MREEEEKKKKEPKKKEPFYKRIFKHEPKVSKEEGVSLQPLKGDPEVLMSEVRFIQKNRIELLNEILRRVIKLVLSQEIPSICKFLMRKFSEKMRSEWPDKPHYFNEYGTLLVKHWMVAYIKAKLTKVNHPQCAPLLDLLTFVEQIFMGDFDKVKVEPLCAIPLGEELEREIKLFFSRVVSSHTIPTLNTVASLVDFESNIRLISFREVVLIVNLIKAAQQKKDLEEPLASLDLSFSDNSIYEPNIKIKFKQEDYHNHNIYFCIALEPEETYLKKCYLGSRTPLRHIPSMREALLKTSLPVEEAMKISGSLEFLRGVESKLIVKAFEGMQTLYPSVPSGVPELSEVLTLHKRVSDLLVAKSHFLVFKEMIIRQINSQVQLICSYSNRVRSEQMFYKYVKTPMESMDISVFVAITKESNTIRIEEALPEESKKLQLSSILMTRKIENNDQNVMNEILENSFKEFKRIPKLIEAISRLEITKRAFTEGKKTEEFNQFFSRMCAILNQRLERHFEKDADKIDLGKQKKMFTEEISKMLVQSLYKQPQIEKDKRFLLDLQGIDADSFKRTELGELNLEEFAFEQAIKQFRDIDAKETPQAKLAQFDRLIREIFKVISLSVPREKITAEVITPIVQYVVLKAQAKHSFRSAL